MGVHKFEQANRLEEINIVDSLKKAGINDQSVVVDYGSGTGIFTVEAAKLTEQVVYGLDASDEMIRLATDKVKESGLGNVVLKKVDKDIIDLDDNSVDLFFLVTVLHEIVDIPAFVTEVKRVLKPGGRIMVIDFIKKEGSFGPSIRERVSAYQAARHFFREDIALESQSILGDNFYLLVLS